MENKIVKVKEDFAPLYRRGDKFKIIKVNTDSDLMEIEAMRLKDHEIYGFDKEDLK